MTYHVGYDAPKAPFQLDIIKLQGSRCGEPYHSEAVGLPVTAEFLRWLSRYRNFEARRCDPLLACKNALDLSVKQRFAPQLLHGFWGDIGHEVYTKISLVVCAPVVQCRASGLRSFGIPLGCQRMIVPVGAPADVGEYPQSRPNLLGAEHGKRRVGQRDCYDSLAIGCAGGLQLTREINEERPPIVQGQLSRGAVQQSRVSDCSAFSRLFHPDFIAMAAEADCSPRQSASRQVDVTIVGKEACRGQACGDKRTTVLLRARRMTKVGGGMSMEWLTGHDGCQRKLASWANA
ncbi:MAG: hypothetical protein CVU33_08015 [Betaproteobacteria bacterium HGW-Betaproteobacteria-6]|nr:MAG: hypothetical protein CVU33_08015 [Betaproteobacteria bacterium HGW-Betaproteobacteria-6]